MASFDEVWGEPPKAQRAQPPPQFRPPAQHETAPPMQQTRPAPRPVKAPQSASQNEADRAAVASRALTGSVHSDVAAAAAAASNATALSALHDALLELRSELDDTRRKIAPVVEASGAAVQPMQSVDTRNDALTITVAVGFTLLILTISLVGGSICKVVRTID